jgi:lipoprotein-anchoring transpeptidase ErfK/SrfK
MLKNYKLILILTLFGVFGAQAQSNQFEQTLGIQIALHNQGFSPAAIDGLMGPQTRRAIKGFQESQSMQPSGELNSETTEKLSLNGELYKTYTITAEDLSGLQENPDGWVKMAEVESLGYETILELVAEKASSYRSLIRKLNPNVNWSNVEAGTEVKIPNIAPFQPDASASKFKVLVNERVVQVFDASGKLIAQFPCTIAASKAKFPDGELKVENFAENPNYTFSPENFPESKQAQKIGKKLIIPPGVNNPVGVVWISLSKPGYGIHGTPEPEDIGQAASHGCFRLTNWDAQTLLRMTTDGMPVEVIK